MKIVLLLFSQFETLDAFGPAEVLGRLPGCQIVCASVQGGICRSAQGVPVMTVPLSEAEGEVLLLPGGMGTRPLAGSKGAILFVGVHRFGFAGPLRPAGRQTGHLQQKILCLGKKARGECVLAACGPLGGG